MYCAAGETMDGRPGDDLGALRALSVSLGTDITRTQGAGGNTSIKIGDVMWVKASGTWLAHALERDIMVPVEVPPLIEALQAGDPRAEKATDFVIDALNAGGLRPSIETSVHGIIPQRVVAHFHCVNTIAWNVQVDSEGRLAALMREALPDLTWAMIPYRRPGTPLARAIAETRERAPDILVLANHGLVVNGDSVEEVGERIERVTAALALPRRSPPAPDLGWLRDAAERLGNYRLPVDPETHDSALDPAAARVALGRALYPDHVIFLGREVHLLIDADLEADDLRGNDAPKMLLAPGKGVLLHEDLTAGGETMARCLAEVVTRIPAGAAINTLTAAQEAELSGWEAEQYRQTLDRKASSS
jgi:rhamnose utilization protein RhaD (predicted bifunctional aldolase and dehydrogenase)